MPTLLGQALEGTQDWGQWWHPERGSECCRMSSPSACATIELAVASLLQANADPSVINCLHNLSRRLATVLQHEERRCQYLTREAKLILALQDEVSAMADGEGGGRPLWAGTPLGGPMWKLMVCMVG